MPGLITHYICGELCLNRIKNESYRKIIEENRQIYNIGTQGPDIFFYYLPCLYRRSIFQLGSLLHTASPGKYIIGLLDSVKDMESAESAAAYIAGYITHYALDYNTHPYIYYKSGFKTEGDKTRKIRYSVNHRNFETNIDTLMLSLVSSEKPSDKRLWELIHADKRQACETACAVSTSIRRTHDIDMSVRRVLGAMRAMAVINRIIQSKSGRRKRLMEFIENISVGEHICSSLIHEQAATEGIDFLNLNKKPWYMPWDDTKAYTTTFTDMFEKAVHDAERMINGAFLYLDDGIIREEISELIGDYSLATGQDSALKLQFQFSDIVYG